MDYYELLGVSSTATDEEIKRAYRRLAIQYHPDKNSDPGVANLFKQITAAYNVLSDPEERRRYDLRHQVLWEQPEPVVRRHPDPAYRPRRNRPRGKSERERMRDLMAGYLPYAQKISIGALIISCSLLVDFLLPRRHRQEVVTAIEVKRTSVRGGTITSIVIRTDGGHEAIIGENALFKTGDQVTVSSSMIFGVMTRMANEGGAIRIGSSIYGNFIFIPAALLFFSILGVIRRNDVEMGFNFGVTNFILLILMFGMVLIT